MNFPYPSESREKDLRDTSPRQWGLQTVALERCRLVHLVRRANEKWTLGIKGKQAAPTAVPHSPAAAATSPSHKSDE